jgi:hypothetical protein
MTALPGSRRTALLRGWREVVWPVLAGVVVASGLLGVWQRTSLLAVVLMVAGLWVLFSVMLYGVASESGLRARPAARIGMISSVWTIALLGLVTALPVAGWFIGLAVGATSPAVADWSVPYLRRAAAELGRWRAPARVAPDQRDVDRAFEQIVTELHDDLHDDNDAA